MAVYPGLRSPGLIEAGCKSAEDCPSAIVPRYIRGCAAPASLKPWLYRRMGRFLRIGDVNIRGCAAPASLKRFQQLWIVMRPAERGVFRGCAAPASLKPCLCISLRITLNRALAHIRGCAAPASLKPGDAYRPSEPGPSFRGISGAAQPRPH